ncbi:MAG: hypothetical protein E7231_00525 [Cellulosilyticum sp.]|nr:hypothetical protein [Cellulosilyticum sp.]
MQICYIPPKEKYSRNNFLKSQMKRELAKFKDEKVQLRIAACMITIAVSQVNLYAKDLNLEKWKGNLDKKGTQILDIIQTVGYWIAIIAAAVDIIKNFKKQDIAGLFAVAFKYAALFGLLNGLPWFFELVGDLFNME